jgi:hypothetical protein
MPDTTQMRRRLEDDEELAVGTVRVLRTGHRTGAPLVARIVELGRQILSRTAHAGAGGITGLRHEAVDHAVEDDAVIEILAAEFLDARHMVGCQILEQLDHHPAVLEFQVEGVFQIQVATRTGIGRAALHA